MNSSRQSLQVRIVDVQLLRDGQEKRLLNVASQIFQVFSALERRQKPSTSNNTRRCVAMNQGGSRAPRSRRLAEKLLSSSTNPNLPLGCEIVRQTWPIPPGHTCRYRRNAIPGHRAASAKTFWAAAAVPTATQPLLQNRGKAKRPEEIARVASHIYSLRKRDSSGHRDARYKCPLAISPFRRSAGEI